MPTSKSKKKTSAKRKEDKQRPYRVDYFLWDEMQKDKALVRSTVIRAVTALDAELQLGLGSHPSNEGTVIRSYRFYKKLSAEPVRKTYFAVDKLFSAKKAVEIMTAIEDRKAPTVIRYEDLGLNPQAAQPAVVVPTPVFIPEWAPDADTSNVTAGRPEPMPSEEYSAASVELLKRLDKERQEAEPFIQSVAANAAQQAKYIIDKAILVRMGYDFDPCQYHGWKYIDLRDGRCTALDADSMYQNERVQSAPAAVVAIEASQCHDEGNATNHLLENCGPQCGDPPVLDIIDLRDPNDLPVLDINTAAPVIDYSPQVLACDSVAEAIAQMTRSDVVLDDEEGSATDAEEYTRSYALIIVGAALMAIAGLVYGYFHYLAK